MRTIQTRSWERRRDGVGFACGRETVVVLIKRRRGRREGKERAGRCAEKHGVGDASRSFHLSVQRAGAWMATAHGEARRMRLQ